MQNIKISLKIVQRNLFRKIEKYSSDFIKGTKCYRLKEEEEKKTRERLKTGKTYHNQSERENLGKKRKKEK